MNSDSFGMIPDKEDEARHAYAEGTVLLRTIADELSELVPSGGISRLKLDRLHEQLYELYELIGNHTVWPVLDDLGIDAVDEVARAAGRDTYSDGTPVSIVVEPPAGTGWSVSRNAYESDIPWLPNTTGNDAYNEFGPIPPGCKVVVLDTPSWRRRKYATRQRATTHTGES